MIRLLILCLALGASFTSRAEELCSGWESKIAEDMQIFESEFTLEAAESALDRLEELTREPRTELSWFAEENAMKFVKGWLLKKAALESLEGTEDSRESPEVRMFCEFLVTKAFYHD